MSLFGAYCSHIFVKRRALVSSVVVHIYGNFMGYPEYLEIFKGHLEDERVRSTPPLTQRPPSSTSSASSPASPPASSSDPFPNSPIMHSYKPPHCPSRLPQHACLHPARQLPSLEAHRRRLCPVSWRTQRDAPPSQTATIF